MKLPSKHQIDEEVTFTPMYLHQMNFGIDAEEISGRIVAIRFTAAKVFYDILSDYYGKIFDGVESTKVLDEFAIGSI